METLLISPLLFYGIGLNDVTSLFCSKLEAMFIDVEVTKNTEIKKTQTESKGCNHNIKLIKFTSNL